MPSEIAEVPTKRVLDQPTVDVNVPAKKMKQQLITNTNDPKKKINWTSLSSAAEAVNSGRKSAVSALNEIGEPVTYKVLEQSGPDHCPVFRVAVQVNNMEFEGFGSSKRDARAAAARTCLTALVSRIGQVLQKSEPIDIDFSSDNFVVDNNLSFHVEEKNPQLQIKIENSPQSNKNESLSGREQTNVQAKKSPINILYEKFSNIEFRCCYGDGSSLEQSERMPLHLDANTRYKVTCIVNGKEFVGYGCSKKLSKIAAAEAALASLAALEAESNDGSPGSSFETCSSAEQVLANGVSKLIHEEFNRVLGTDCVHSKKKVMAGIAITENKELEGAKVVALGTGTKCVSGEYMSVAGNSLNDCHAEVVTRRCFQRYLYNQLAQYAAAKDPTIPIPESDLEPISGGGYQMKPSRQVHLYITTAPCGDARIFSPHEEETHVPDRHPNRLARGQLRTKIESGEGTIPVKNNDCLQTWDGVLQGERLLTMSCSDKIARWCCLGLQGALLSTLIRPIYIDSLVLGSLLHKDHVSRALCGRIKNHLKILPLPFCQRLPILARSSSVEARNLQRAPSFSVNWCLDAQFPEILNATTGKLNNGEASLLSKQKMFARWHYLIQKLPVIIRGPSAAPKPIRIPNNLENLPYGEAKTLNKEYQISKKFVTDAFSLAGLGRWIKKPMEQDNFTCDLSTIDHTKLFIYT